MILESTLLTVPTQVPQPRLSPPGVKFPTFTLKFGELIQSEVIHSSAAKAFHRKLIVKRSRKRKAHILKIEKTLIASISRSNSEILIKNEKYTNSF